jgi:hypothetical protein
MAVTKTTNITEKKINITLCRHKIAEKRSLRIKRPSYCSCIYIGLLMFSPPEDVNLFSWSFSGDATGKNSLRQKAHGKETRKVKGVHTSWTSFKPGHPDLRRRERAGLLTRAASGQTTARRVGKLLPARPTHRHTPRGARPGNLARRPTRAVPLPTRPALDRQEKTMRTKRFRASRQVGGTTRSPGQNIKEPNVVLYFERTLKMPRVRLSGLNFSKEDEGYFR